MTMNDTDQELFDADNEIDALCKEATEGCAKLDAAEKNTKFWKERHEETRALGERYCLAYEAKLANVEGRLAAVEAHAREFEGTAHALNGENLELRAHLAAAKALLGCLHEWIGGFKLESGIRAVDDPYSEERELAAKIAAVCAPFVATSGEQRANTGD